MYCIYAISGDCAPNGMGKKGDMIPVARTEWFPHIKRMLKAAIDWEFATLEPGFQYTHDDPAYIEHRDAVENCLDLGIIHHKWHTRTTWALGEFEIMLEDARYRVAAKN